MVWLSPASRAPWAFYDLILGLAPQALCCRPLRGLGAKRTLWTFSHQLRKVTHNQPVIHTKTQQLWWHVACTCRGGFGHQDEKEVNGYVNG